MVKTDKVSARLPRALEAFQLGDRLARVLETYWTADATQQYRVDVVLCDLANLMRVLKVELAVKVA